MDHWAGKRMTCSTQTGFSEKSASGIGVRAYVRLIASEEGAAPAPTSRTAAAVEVLTLLYSKALPASQ